MAQKAKKPIKKTDSKTKRQAPTKTTKAAKVMKAPQKPVAKAKPVAKPVAAKAVAKPVSKTTAKPIVLTQKNMIKPAAKPLPTAPAVAVKVTKPTTAPVANKMMPTQQPANNNKDQQNQIVARKPYQPMFARPPVPYSDKPIDFKVGDHVVYPAHGVGQITGLENTKIGGMDIALFSIVFEKDRMRLKVPVIKAQASGLRKLVSTDRLKDALKTLKGRARIRRVMWSRRAQEYEMKINSGDPMAIAEVLRDLKRSNDDSEQSYSERQIYQSALERLAREVAAVNKITEVQATAQIEDMMGMKEKKAAAAAAAA